MRFWLDDRLVDADQAKVSVLDHGFTVGDGVFETLKVVAGPVGAAVPFAADRHVARLARSAAGLGLSPPDQDVVLEAMAAVCAANPVLAAGGRLRVTLTAGAGPLGSDRGGAPVTLAVAASRAKPWPPTTRLALSPWPRNERSPLAGLKSTSYAENVLMLAHAKALGADEALLTNLVGNLCEGTGSNVFVVVDGQLVTPPLASGCLAGITRELTIEWCAAAGSPVVEVDVPMTGLPGVQEVFVSSSTRDVHPVSQILSAQGGSLWAGEPGPVTSLAGRLFSEHSAQEVNP